MPKSQQCVCNHTSMIVQSNNNSPQNASPVSQQTTEGKDQDPPPNDYQFPSYNVITLLAMLEGITSSDKFLIILSCFMAIAAMGSPITKRMLLLIKAVLSKKPNSPLF